MILAALWPDPVFLWLVNSSGAVALFCDVLIAIAQLRMRRRLEREAPERLVLRMWHFPWLTYASIAAMVAVTGRDGRWPTTCARSCGGASAPSRWCWG